MQRELKELEREVNELTEKAKQIKEAKEKLTELDSNEEDVEAKKRMDYITERSQKCHWLTSAVVFK